MALDLGELSGKISLDDSPFQRGYERAIKSMDTLASKGAAAARKYDREFTIAGAAVFGALGLAAKAAEEAQQANRRLEQVFRSMGDESGQAAEEAKQQADELSRLVGVDDEVIKGGQAKLATFQAVSDETARMNGVFERATEASVDLSAAGFGSVDSAAVMLGKALQDPITGMTALRRVGVTLTEQEREQVKALVESGEQYKAQSIILGAVEKQVGGVGEATATASAKFGVAAGEFQESVGQQVLPAFEGLLNVGADALDVFGELPEPVQQTAVGITAVGAAGLIAAPRIVATVAALRDLRTAATAANVRAIATAGAVAAIGATAIATTASAAGMRKALDEALDTAKASNAQENVNGLTTSFDALRAKQEDLNNSSGVWDTLSDGVESFGFRLTNSWNHIDDQVVEYQRRIDEMGAHHDAIFGQAAARTGLTTAEIERLAAVAGVDLSQGVNTAARGLEQYYDTTVNGSAATGNMTEAQSVLTQEFVTAEDAVKAYRQELDNLDNGYVDTQAASDALQASIDDVTGSLKENGRTLDAGTEKGRNNRAALRDVADGARDLAVAVLEQTGSQEKANAQIEKGREQLIKLLGRFGITGKAAEEYADKLGLIPEDISTNAAFRDKEARTKITAFKNFLDLLPSEVAIDARFRGMVRGENMDAAATGGPVHGTTLVGERGPEVVTFSRQAYVTANNQLGTASAQAPSHITIVDADGVLMGTFRVAAQNELRSTITPVLTAVRAGN